MALENYGYCQIQTAINVQTSWPKRIPPAGLWHGCFGSWGGSLFDGLTLAHGCDGGAGKKDTHTKVVSPSPSPFTSQKGTPALRSTRRGVCRPEGCKAGGTKTAAHLTRKMSTAMVWGKYVAYFLFMARTRRGPRALRSLRHPSHRTVVGLYLELGWPSTSTTVA